MGKLRRIVLIFVSGVLLPVLIQAQEAAFTQGNAYYEKGVYDSAITKYESVLSSGTESASLYFNLGNAYFKRGDLGHAVLNYLRAERLDPTNEDIANNLDFARQFSRVQMEGVELSPVDAFLKSIVGKYRINSLAWWSSLLFILFIGTLIVRFGLGYNLIVMKSATLVMLILFVVVGGLTTYKYRSEYVVHRGVLVAQDCTIYSGPSPTASEEFQGSPGLIVEVIGESASYWEVLFENKRRGWVKADAVALI